MSPHFCVAMLTAMRPTELSLLEISQVSRTKIEVIYVFIMKKKLCSTYGLCKNLSGGLKQSQEVLTEVPIFNGCNLDWKVNVYQDIDKHLRVWENIKLPKAIKTWFFLGTNRSPSRLEYFLKWSAVSSHQIRKIIQQAADANNVVGYSDHYFVVTRSIRKTCTQRMVDTGVPDTAPMKRT